jgi:membrane associated rhomboid family serine protease
MAPRLQLALPKPGKALTGILVTLVVAYFVELGVLRYSPEVIDRLMLSPRAVIEDGAVWQLFTYTLLHAPGDPFHLFGNLLYFYIFGTRVEGHFGARRFLIFAITCGVAGGVLTVLVGLATRIDLIGNLLPYFWVRPHLGASGAAMGVMIAFGLLFPKVQMQLFFVGAIEGRALMIVVLAIEVIRAVSSENVSSSAHFGGMIAAFIIVKLGFGSNRARLEKKKKKLEHDLRVIQGGRTPPSNDPKDWN